ncbi:hypothetical protein [Nocardia puris]|uniref:Uncharacterized protein n=1 Tax=Nocardia puris TaxID=208602 RepID=A0A366DFF6_9NOCA|nr:hypothetical protein [Nocardia puris]RBO88783.1 hypothetical protein DFR74_1087 [Nocardia puris]
MKKPKVERRVNRETGGIYFKVTREGTSAFLLLSPEELFELANQSIDALGGTRNDQSTQ